MWPIAKSLAYIESSETPTTPTTPTHLAPDVEVSWQVQSSYEQKPRLLTKYRSSSLPLVGPTAISSRPAPHGSFDTLPSPTHEQSQQENHLLSHSMASRKLDFHTPSSIGNLQSHQEQYTVGGQMSSKGSLASLSSRAEPDGQSDISSVSPEPITNEIQSERSSVSVLTPPPSTPLPLQESTDENSISPSMIRSALESLQKMQQDTAQSDTSPSNISNHSQICPETVANALSVFIRQESNSQSVSSDTLTYHLSPPPSSPLSESNTPSLALSSSDLVSALSALVIPSRQSSVGPSGENSVVTSVPSGTPNDDKKEWLKLGFKPEDVIQALTVLSLQRGEEADYAASEDLALSPIQEEKGYLTAKHCIDRKNPSHECTDLEQSPAPPDFVFSPPELDDSVTNVSNHDNTDSAFINSCSPSDDVLYS